MAGSRLTRIAPTCNIASTTITAIPFHHATLVLVVTALASPAAQESPTTMVIVISVGEKVPVITRAHPRRNSQMNSITANYSK
jgi:hypothetical protein